MSAPNTHENAILCDAESILASAQQSLGPESRLVVIEGAASRLGGWSLAAYRERFGGADVPDAKADQFAAALACQLSRLPIPAPLSLAALGRTTQPREKQRTQGAFYTDFRLARFVGGLVACKLSAGMRIVDLAAGSGILLAAAVIAAAGEDRRRAGDLVAQSVCAADSDATALRACRASLAALCDDLDSISELQPRLRQQDSLIEGHAGWSDIAPNGFDVVVGNPPWEKVKISRHEFLRTNGCDRHYGDHYGLGTIDNEALADERAQRAAYAFTIAARYPLAGHGELDLYKAFCACSHQVLREGGTCCLIVPAGLIRSKGTEQLRRELLESCGIVSFTVIENRARFFAIDTRFKFLVVQTQKGGRRRSIKLLHAQGNKSRVTVQHSASIDRTTISRIRPDLTLPEVRGNSDWRLAVAMHERGTRLDGTEGPYVSKIVREVDMTRDRSNFLTSARHGDLPLVEGRMIAQHRFGAKAYRFGTGRRALWDTRPCGQSVVEPQFFYPSTRLPLSAFERAQRPRIGFCDVTGQTNERSIIAARVPAGVVCGNKVPTITFEDDDDEHLSWLFLAIANSLPLDWIARRVLTTSVNYFVLRSLPLPPIVPRTRLSNRLAQLAKQLASIDSLGRELTKSERWRLGEWRAEIDARVVIAWGLGPADLGRMFYDFALLDRGQPPLPGERHSTITKDLALSWVARLTKTPDDTASKRANAARRGGAFAYTPSEYAEGE